jgi:ABC-type polysaccharide/polyol phosphate export permease
MSTESSTSLDFSQNITTSEKDAIYFSTHDQTKLAIKDIIDGTLKWRTWLTLAYLDIKLRYRRSVLGPFWITLSMAITVYSMGYLYGHLFHTDLQTYYPFLVAGMLSWSLIATAINDSTDVFILSEDLIKTIKLPYTLYVHKLAARNMIIFFHNVIVMIPILIIFHQAAKVNFNTLILFPSLIIIYINIMVFSFVVGIMGARYRDITQIIKSLIQVAFFLTPVLWNPNILSKKAQSLILLNPFYSFVELIRAPLMGYMPGFSIVAITCSITIFGMLFCFLTFKKYRSRIIYWL